MKHKSIFFLLSLIFSSFCLSAQELPKEVVWQEIEAPEPTLSENIIKLQIIDNHILSTMQSKSKSF